MQRRRETHPLVDLLVDGRLPAGGTRNFEPVHQRFDGQTLTEERHRQRGEKQQSGRRTEDEQLQTSARQRSVALFCHTKQHTAAQNIQVQPNTLNTQQTVEGRAERTESGRFIEIIHIRSFSWSF